MSTRSDRARSGAAVVELAICLPMIVIFVVALLVFASPVYGSSVWQAATSTAAVHIASRNVLIFIVLCLPSIAQSKQ